MREIAQRLAMSEADLYRKQRVAIDAVAGAIREMEQNLRNGNGNKLQGASDMLQAPDTQEGNRPVNKETSLM